MTDLIPKNYYIYKITRSKFHEFVENSNGFTGCHWFVKTNI